MNRQGVLCVPYRMCGEKKSESGVKRIFHSEFKQALADDPDYKRDATIDQFLLICEKLIYMWQQVQFQYDFRNDKRAPSPADLSRNSKKTKSSQPPKAASMATEVGAHCEGCGKPNHL